MSSFCDYMDHPDWTPEQRVSVALVEALRIKRSEEEQARAARFHARNSSTPATAGPSRDAAGDFSPLDRAVAGDPLSTTARSGQVTPSPADTAARGDLIEQGVSA
ncbi:MULTISPECIES: hypothetical protein [unclassified Rhodanobacter]|uniref:hypothetical protein n=1 Tax=unclassified Rhodanobacter TaxID=2621553 RepID=UPI001BDF3A4C|nr:MULTISPECIES: hypothetical protein [unclassified Rhodanobacter]MBT2142725.1 hypothetical protein [Rhodanobacter sp. LX-99]MBT2148202.1 hypothetical protein [Rhodanobacter sp. LX-100]